MESSQSRRRWKKETNQSPLRAVLDDLPLVIHETTFHLKLSQKLAATLLGYGNFPRDMGLQVWWRMSSYNWNIYIGTAYCEKRLGWSASAPKWTARLSSYGLTSRKESSIAKQQFGWTKWSNIVWAPDSDSHLGWLLLIWRGLTASHRHEILFFPGRVTIPIWCLWQLLSHADSGNGKVKHVPNHQPVIIQCGAP